MTGKFCNWLNFEYSRLRIRWEKQKFYWKNGPGAAQSTAHITMFYAVLALTVVRGFSTSKHAGVLAFFDREYVKTGIFSKALSRKFHLAFDHRQSQDYGEFVLIDGRIAQETIADATEFVDQIENYLINSVFPGLQNQK